VGLLAAATLPFLLWHRVIADIFAAFEPHLRWYVGLTPWALMIAGLIFFIPVWLSAGRDPEGRFYPQARNAYAGWGITLYLLGLMLATQVARIHNGAG